MKSKDKVERGAAEEQSRAPLTETEERASRRPPGRGDQPAERPPARPDQQNRPEEPDELPGAAGHA